MDIVPTSVWTGIPLLQHGKFYAGYTEMFMLKKLFLMNVYFIEIWIGYGEFIVKFTWARPNFHINFIWV